MIESCSFGNIVIDGRKYTFDLVIYPDGRVEGPWYRESGHRLSSGDIRELIRSGPDVIVAGTGISGLVKPEKELERLLSERGIEFIAAPNEEAIKVYNDLSSRRSVGACFHLTC